MERFCYHGQGSSSGRPTRSGSLLCGALLLLFRTVETYSTLVCLGLRAAFKLEIIQPKVEIPFGLVFPS